MSNPCDSVRIKYKGNGTQTQFTFPFTYMHWYDVTVGLWDDNKKIYVDQSNKFVFANATTIEFLTAPPAPPDAGIYNIIIGRNTDITQMQATFYPGSSIRAEDLNDDFDQLRLAIQENRCQIEAKLEQIQTDFWAKASIRGRTNPSVDQAPYETIYKRDQEDGFWDQAGAAKNAIPTAGAISARLDPYVQDTLPASPTVEQKGKRWINPDKASDGYWSPEADAWVVYQNTGPRGEQGPRGEKGEEGPQGPPLALQGYIQAGPWSAPSNPIAGDMWIADGTISGFPGGGTPVAGDGLVYTGASWINVGQIRGPQGSAGPQGPVGPQGAVGPQGLQGPTGPTGPTGQVGPQGPQGPAGPIGPKGDAGPVGPRGLQGVQGLTGPVGPQGIQGPAGTALNVLPPVADIAARDALTGLNPGDSVLTIADGGFWTWDGTQWLSASSIVGPEGPKGDTGATGPQGIQGTKGDTGAIGPEGPTGPQGTKGDTGAEGPTGPTGPQGTKGDTGPAGPTGPQGPKGDTGAEGPQGLRGEKGEKGDIGLTGPDGPTGATGGVIAVTVSTSPPSGIAQEGDIWLTV